MIKGATLEKDFKNSAFFVVTDFSKIARCDRLALHGGLRCRQELLFIVLDTFRFGVLRAPEFYGLGII